MNPLRSTSADVPVEMTMRDAVEADLPTIVEIYNATVPTRMVTAELEPTTVEARLPWFREHAADRYPFWVMELDGRVIGWLDFKKFLPRSAYHGTAEISVYVDENFRRRGVARRLLQAAIARAPSLRISALVGLIFGHNRPSLELFEQLGFRRWGFLPAVAQLDGVDGDLVVMGKHCHPASGSCSLSSSSEEARKSRAVSSKLTSMVGEEPCEKRFEHEEEDENKNVHSAYGITKPIPQSEQARGYREPLRLMHTLMQYRHEPIHAELLRVRDKYSMLHLDVLILIYHFAKICSGAILEIGAFVGGATIAVAFGMRDSGQNKKLIAIEAGGSVKHKRLGTRNILRDLERNLARERVANLVTLIKGHSFKPETVSAVRQALNSDRISLLILDADAAKRRDIECYRDKFAEECWMVIDDYYGADANEKITPSRADVDTLVASGALEPLGFYGWSTWVGRWRGGQ